MQILSERTSVSNSLRIQKVVTMPELKRAEKLSETSANFVFSDFGVWSLVLLLLGKLSNFGEFLLSLCHRLSFE